MSKVKKEIFEMIVSLVSIMILLIMVYRFFHVIYCNIHLNNLYYDYFSGSASRFISKTWNIEYYTCKIIIYPSTFNTSY